MAFFDGKPTDNPFETNPNGFSPLGFPLEPTIFPEAPARHHRRRGTQRNQIVLAVLLAHMVTVPRNSFFLFAPQNVSFSLSGPCLPGRSSGPLYANDAGDASDVILLVAK